MACEKILDPFATVESKLEVSEKFLQLMQDALSEDSLYTRSKDTAYHQFDNLNITAQEKAKLVSEQSIKMTIQMTAQLASMAVQWATAERDGAYSLAKIKADAEVSIAQAAKGKEELCLIEKQVDLACANITATIAGSIRENGKVATYKPDGCTPDTLESSGLKYEQTQQVIAATYQTHADAYRKSGVVQIGVDAGDQLTKGLSGGVEPITDGYTNQQSLNAERQRVGYEDSKANHAANSASTMIGQLLSSETLSDSNTQDVIRWRKAVDRLLAKSEKMSDIPDVPPEPTA